MTEVIRLSSQMEDNPLNRGTSLNTRKKSSSETQRRDLYKSLLKLSQQSIMEVANDFAKEDDEQQHNLSGIDVANFVPEILGKIFGYLSTQEKGRAAQVCSAWRNVAAVKGVWQETTARLDLYEPPSKLLLASLAERSINTVAVTNPSSDHLCDLVDAVVSLKRLHLVRFDDVPDVTLSRTFTKKRPNLRAVRILGSRLITDITMSRVAMNACHLRHLFLDGCSQLTDITLFSISQYLKHLTSLYLRNCETITDTGIGYLAGVDPDGDLKPLQLKTLYISQCRQLTDEALLLVGMFLQVITSLVIGPSSKMTELSMAHLPLLTGLETLYLSGRRISDAWLTCFEEDNFNIGTLNLVACHYVTNSGLSSIASLKYLRKLRIENCKGIGDDGLLLLANRGSKLSQLTITNCPKFTDESLKNLLGLPCLRRLELNNCPGIGFQGLDCLANGKSKIETLILAGCQKLDQTALRVISSGLFHLRFLDLEPGYISRKGLSLAAQTLPDLKSLVSGGKQLIGDVRLLKLAANFGGTILRRPIRCRAHLNLEEHNFGTKI